MALVKERHQRKIAKLFKEYKIIIGCQDNPNTIITNLTGIDLTPSQQTVLIYGLKYGLATRPKESVMIVIVENIYEQLLYLTLMKQERIKNSLRSLACNFIDFEDKRLKTEITYMVWGSSTT